MQQGEREIDGIAQSVVDLKLTLAKWSGVIVGAQALLAVAVKYLLPLFGSALAVALIAGCAAPWQSARAAIATGRAAAGVLEPELERIDDGEARSNATVALGVARGGLDLGDTIVDAWEAAGGDPPVGWQKWAAFALQGLKDVFRILVAAGVPVPSQVSLAVSALNLLALALGAT